LCNNGNGNQDEITNYVTGGFINHLKSYIMKTSRVVLGILAGAAVGALVGVLFAPDKGSNTRRKIVRRSEDFVDGLKANLNDRIDHLRDQAGDAVDKFAEKLHTPMSEMEEMKRKAENGKKRYEPVS